MVDSVVSVTGFSFYLSSHVWKALVSVEEGASASQSFFSFLLEVQNEVHAALPATRRRSLPYSTLYINPLTSILFHWWCSLRSSAATADPAPSSPVLALAPAPVPAVSAFAPHFCVLLLPVLLPSPFLLLFSPLLIIRRC